MAQLGIQSFMQIASNGNIHNSYGSWPTCAAERFPLCIRVPCLSMLDQLVHCVIFIVLTYTQCFTYENRAAEKIKASHTNSDEQF